MTDYLKLFNEELRSGLPADVETPGTEDWYTKGIPKPGQADYRVEGQPEEGAIPQRGGAPAAPPTGVQVDYGKLFTQELERPDDAGLTAGQDEQTRVVIDKAMKSAQGAALPGMPILSWLGKKVFGVDVAATNRNAIRNIAGNFVKSLDMYKDMFDDYTTENALKSYDESEEFRQMLRTPPDPDAIPILTRGQLEKHMSAHKGPDILDEAIDHNIFEMTAEEELRQMDRNVVQTYIEDLATTGQEMVPQVTAYLLGKKYGGKTGGALLSSAWMSTQIAGPIYQQKVEEGMKPRQAFKQAITSAAGQSVLESWGLGKWMNSGGSLLTRFAKGGFGEAATEWLQEYWDLAADIWYDDEKQEAVFQALDDAWEKGENPFTKEGAIYEKIREDFWQATKTGAYSALVAFPLGAFGGAVSGDAREAEKPGITDEDMDLLTRGEADIDDVTEGQTRKADIGAMVDRVYQEGQEPAVEAAPIEQTPTEFFETGQAEADYFTELDGIMNEEGITTTPEGIVVPKEEQPAPIEEPTEAEKLRYRELKAIKAPKVADVVEKKKLREKIAESIKRKGFFDISQELELSQEIEGPEKIRTPAIKYRGKIYEGKNHLEAYEKLVEDIGGEVPDADFIDGKMGDGFLTTKETFIGRDEGFDLAREMGQLRPGEEFKRGYLVSEALEDEDLKIGQQITPFDKAVEVARSSPGPKITEGVDSAHISSFVGAVRQKIDTEGTVFFGGLLGEMDLKTLNSIKEWLPTQAEYTQSKLEDILEETIGVSQQVAPKAKKAPAPKAKKAAAKKVIKPPALPKKVIPPQIPVKKVTQPPVEAKTLIEKTYKGAKFEYHKPAGMVQKAIKEFATLVGRGRKVFFFKPTEQWSRIKGFHVGDSIFVSDKADPAWHTYGHESTHDLRVNRPDLYAKLEEAIDPYIDIETLAAYGAELNAARASMGQGPLTDAKIKEEYIAEYVGIQVRNKSFWRNIRDKSLELFDSLATSVMKLIDASGEMWLDKYQDFMFTDADAVRRHIADVYVEYWSEGGITAKPGKKLGIVESAKVGYAVENLQQNLDPKMVRSLLENKKLSEENLKILNILGEAGAIDDLLGVQLSEQKLFTREFYDKAKKKHAEEKIKYKGDPEKLQKAKAKFEKAEQKYKRSKNMSRAKVREIMTRDERPSFMNITHALKNNKELRSRVEKLDKQLKKLSPGASLFENDGSFKHHPIEERVKPDPSKVFDLLPKFGGFRRNISQTFVDEMADSKRESFRKEIVSWVEEAYRKGIEPQIFGYNLQEGTDKQYPLAPAIRKAHKTLGAVNLNAVCPMFNIGNHGCYLDGCYLTAMGAGGNGVNFYRTAAYMGEVLQLKDAEIKALNKVGGLRMNGVGDTDMTHLPQYRDIFKHANMRGLKLKIISKQPALFELMHTLQKDSDKDVKKKALETVVQPTVDPYWVPIAEDDFPGSGVQAMGIAQSAKKFGPESAVESFQELLGREAKVIDGQLYRKYGFGWDQLTEMSKKYPKVKTQPRLVVGTFKEIAEYALTMPNVIQTWMHASVRPGMYSEIDGKVLEQGEVGNFTKRVLITFKKGDFKVHATNTDGSIAKNAKTYTALEVFIKNEYSPADQKKIFQALWGQNKKDPSALCCRAGANLDACMDCTSHCSNGTSYTGTRLGKIAGKGKELGIFADPDTDPDVIKQEVSIEAASVQSELPAEYDATMKERGVKRSKFGVGKEIGGSVYIHKMYEENIPEIEAAKEKLPDDFLYAIVKWNKRNGSITFTKVEDFNSAEEPTVGDQFLVKEDGSTRFMKANKDPWIYHHKWTMVKDDYAGFDIVQSKLRSLQWTGIKDVDTSRAGKWSFWNDNIVPRLGPVGRSSSFPDKLIVSQQISPALKKQATVAQLEKLGWKPEMQMYTQIPGTKGTYDKVATWLKKQGVKGKAILDYSAGLGYGAKKMNSDSFEPFPQKGFDPTYTDPKKVDKKYGAIVNNAVLNVIPGDSRAGVIDHIGSLIDTDGFAFIQARGRDFLDQIKNPVFMNKQTGEALTGWRKRDGNDITTYQKGYANNAELGNEIVGQLGSEFTWSPAPAELKLSSPAVIIKRKAKNELSQQVDMGSIWYSQMENVIKEKVQAGPPKQIKANLQAWAKKGMFKQEELDYSGIMEWLDDQTGKVSREDVIDYMFANHVEISEKSTMDMTEGLYTTPEFAAEYLAVAEILAGDEGLEITDDIASAMNDYRYDATVDSKDIIDDWLDGWDISYHDVNEAAIGRMEDKGAKAKYAEYVVPGAKRYRELLIQLPKSAANFISSHWGNIPNIVAHVRFNERLDTEGRRWLFLEELQSDWHQKGRKEGYGPSERYKLARSYEEVIDEIRETTDDAVNVKWMKSNKDKLTDLQKKALDLWEKQEALGGYESAYDEGVADAPFKKTWKTLALKRMVKYAADNGFDGISWTSGQAQIERYDLSKYYKELRWKQNADGTYDVVGDPVSGMTLDIVIEAGGIDLEAAIGKDLSEQIINSTDESGKFSGDGLRVGGRGMVEFYDKILANEFNKFFNKKAWGEMKIAPVNLGIGAWSITVKEGGRLPSNNEFDTERQARLYIDGLDSVSTGIPWSQENRAEVVSKPIGDMPGTLLSPEAKSKASVEGMVMFNLDIGSEIDPETENLLNEKFGRVDRSIADKVKESMDEFWKNKTTRIVDRLHPIKEKLGGEGTAYMLHRGLPGVQSVLNALMAHGKLAFDKSKAIITKERHKGFLPWIKSLGPDAEKAFYWIMVKRAEALDVEGREHWLTPPVRKQILKWVGNPTGKKSWEQINTEFQEWNKNVLSLATDSGLLSEEQTKEWMSDFYIPFYRVFEDKQARLEYLKGPAKGNVNLSARVQRLQGAEARIGDPFENILRNWSHLVSESMSNVARGEAYTYGIDNKIQSGLSMIDEEGNEVSVPLLEEVSWADTVVFKPGGEGGSTFVHQKTGDEILSFKKGGKSVFFKVNDPELFQALSLVNRPYVDNILMKALSGSKRMLTAGATFGPAFRVANMLRDTLHTFQITEGWTFKPLWSTAKGFVSAWREDQDFVEFMSSGHAFGGSYVRAEDPKALEKYVKRIANADQVSLKTAADRVLSTPKKMLEFWDRIGEASENAARVALYTNLKKEGKTHLESAFAARDLMDFQMSGNSNVIGFLINTVPFLNARMQGLYRMGRAAQENPKTFFYKGAMIFAATMLLWLNNRDDERYQALESWDKFQYYHFWIGDKHFRIPKPFETGVVFSTAWEAMADASTGNEEAEHLWTFTKHALGETFAFNPIPQGVRPLAEQWANKSFFTGRPIESQYQQKLKRGERYDPWTSETLILAGKLGIPPKRAQALIRGYTADIGMGLLAVSDLAVRTFGDFPDRPAKRIDEYPMIGRFVKEAAPARNVKYMSKFWDSMGELDKLVNTVNMYKNSGDFEGAVRVANANRKLLQMRKGLNKQRQRIRKISYEVKRIWKDPNLNSKQKRQMIDKLTGERNKLVETIYKQYLKET